MKILIVTARYYPEQFSITNIAEELFKMGNSITVLTGKPNYGYGKIVKGYENINYQEINGIKIHRVNERVRKSNFRSLVLNYLSIYFEYKRFLKKHREVYDVVLSFYANHYFHADVLFVPLYNNSHTSSLIPQKVIEYLMYSKPILGMLVGDGAKILSMASQHNIICDQTVESLVSAVDRLVASDINTLKQCGRQNRTFFLSDDKFSIESICLNLHNLLNESLINNATKRRIKK